MVADTKTQKRYKITTNASTLGELKQTLAANNIDYSGMAFTEGVTKTTLNDDASPLPTNVPYKGTTTNNLVILLTNTRKNIASGMDRKEAYSFVKEHNLAQLVQDTFGKNFTQVKTSELEKFINDHSDNSGNEECTDECADEPNDEEESPEAEEMESKVEVNAEDLAGLKECLEKTIGNVSSALYLVTTMLDKVTQEMFSDKAIDDMIAEL